jgi:sugar/nucleoside kinase (ribokinase family)
MAQTGVLAMGEVLVEILRPAPDQPLDTPGTFLGPFLSGAPAIFAVACARLGLPTAFVGTVGDDAFARLIRRGAQRDRLDLTYLAVDPQRPTACSFVSYRANGQREFVFHLRDAAAGHVDPTWPPVDLTASVDWLHVCGSTLAVNDDWRDACLRAARTARERGAHVSFDPNLRPELLGGRGVAEVCGPMLLLADIVLPSAFEAAMLTGEPTAEAGCLRLLEFGADLVVLKRGALGATAFTAETSYEIDAFPVEEVDPTGAGDVFAAGLAAALLEGYPPAEAVRWACAAGALSVTRRGPAEGAPTRAELRALLDAEIGV